MNQMASGFASASLLRDEAERAAAAEGIDVEELVQSALALVLALSPGGRDSLRYVQSSHAAEATAELIEGCNRAIAKAADRVLRAELAGWGREHASELAGMTDEQLEAEAVEAVRAARQWMRAEAEAGAREVSPGP